MYKILICDDETDIRNALNIYLSAQGYETVLCANGQEALDAVAHGADCLGVGAAFATHTKEDVNVLPRQTLIDICNAVDVPVVAIGGIHKDNILELKGSGVDGVALVSAIFSAKDIEAECRELKALSEQIIVE